MKKMIIITLTLMLLVAVLSGCVKASEAPMDTAPMPTTEPTPAAEQNTAPSTEPASKIADNMIDAIGKLNGRIDSNSVEIEISPEDTLAFRVTDVLEQLKDIKDGDMVKFSYSPNENGQLNITKIEKAE